MLVYQVESSLWLWSIYFLLHCFSRLLKRLWAILAIQFSLEGGPWEAYFFSRAVVCLLHLWWAVHSWIWSCNASWLVSITFSRGLGCLGETALYDDRAVLGPVGPQTHYFIRQECLSRESRGNGKEMSWHVDCCCSRVDICLDTRGDVFLKAI